MKPVFWGLLFVTVAGCGSAPPAAPSAVVQTITPQTIWEQTRTGAFQVKLALNALVDTLQVTEELKTKADPTFKPAIEEIEGLVNKAGSILANDGATPDELPTFQKTLPVQQKKRAESLQHVKEASEALEQAITVSTTLSSRAVEPIRPRFDKVTSLVQTAVEDLKGATAAFSPQTLEASNVPAGS